MEKQSAGWSAISSSIKKSLPSSDRDRELVACVGVPGDNGLLISSMGDISSISFSLIDSLIFFLLRLDIISSESVLLTKLSFGDVSSSRNRSSTDAVIWANLLPISMDNARSHVIEIFRSTDSLWFVGGEFSDKVGEAEKKLLSYL